MKKRTVQILAYRHTFLINIINFTWCRTNLQLFEQQSFNPIMSFISLCPVAIMNQSGIKMKASHVVIEIVDKR